MSDNRVHSAGKGDKPRPTVYNKYSENYDLIDWTSHKKLEAHKDNINQKNVDEGTILQAN